MYAICLQIVQDLQRLIVPHWYWSRFSRGNAWIYRLKISRQKRVECLRYLTNTYTVGIVTDVHCMSLLNLSTVYACFAMFFNERCLPLEGKGNTSFEWPLLWNFVGDIHASPTSSVACPLCFWRRTQCFGRTKPSDPGHMCEAGLMWHHLASCQYLTDLQGSWSAWANALGISIVKGYIYKLLNKY